VSFSAKLHLPRLGQVVAQLFVNLLYNFHVHPPHFKERLLLLLFVNEEAILSSKTKRCSSM
jgi:hypothetical protein